MKRQYDKRMTRTMLRRTGALLLTAVLLAAPVTAIAWKPVTANAANAPAGSIQLVSEEPVTAGAVLQKYQWTSTRGSKSIQVTANVVKVDLQNPYVKLDVMTGVGGQTTKRQSVRGMANETGAAAGINGDFFNTLAEGVMMGPEVSNGQMISTPPFLPGWYSFAITKDNKPVIDLFTFSGSVKTKDGAEFPLSGINKEYYWYEPNGEHSHIDSMFIYTNAWGQTDRANDRNTDLNEVLVRDGVIQKIQYGTIPVIPAANEYILRTEGKAAAFVNAHMKVGDKITANYSVMGQDPTKNLDAKTFKTMIGGSSILVDEGQPATLSRPLSDVSGSSPVARTGVGFSKDQRYVYLITGDNSSGSAGLTIPEFQQLMVNVGVWRGLNLDGGGSTQMVSRPLGETSTQVVNSLPSGYERPVVNGLGVFSTAPAGQAKSLKINGPTTLLAGEKGNYSVGGYDEYYNPIKVGQVTPQWSVGQSQGAFTGNTFTPSTKGKVTITAKAGTATQSLDVNVVGKEEIASMTIEPSSAVVMEGGGPIKLNVRVRLKSGEERVVPGDLFQWEVRGTNGSVTGDTLQLAQTTNLKGVELIARYDGFSTVRSLGVGYTKLFADFDKQNPDVTFTGFPAADVKGQVKLVSEQIPGSSAPTNAVYLGYDMKSGKATKAAYLTLGQGNGVAIEGQPKALTMKVKGDNSRNWLRVSVTDAKGSEKLLDFTKSINWSDWRTVTADLASANLAYPIKLNKIYVANPEVGQDEREAVGGITIDDISFQYETAAPEQPRNQIKLTIDNKTVQVNGTPMTVDQAPVIVSGNTLVPLRFVTEALKGEIEWSDAERKVTVHRNGQLAEVWLDKTGMIMNGKAVTAEVPPVLMNQLTMVPLRILTENLGWKVTWDQSTKTVTLE